MMTILPFLYYSGKWANTKTAWAVYIIAFISFATASILEYHKIWKPHFILADVLIPFTCCMNIIVFGLKNIKVAFRNSAIRRSASGKIVIDLSNPEHVRFLKETTPIILVCWMSLTALILIYWWKLILLVKSF
jgi:hypothetical protein